MTEPGAAASIRPAAEDPAAYRRLRLASLAESPRAFGSTLAREQAFTDDDWAVRITDLAFLVHDGTEHVGLGAGYRSGPGTVEVVSMWVRPDRRGRGLSRLLLDAIVGAARAEGARLTLQVDAANEAARGAYLAYGFEPTGAMEPLSDDPGHLAERMVLRP